MKPHVLFVTEKWRDARPESPLTNNYHNLFGSLESSGLADQSRLHFDEHFHKCNESCDEELIKIAMNQKPDITVFCLIPWYKYIPKEATIAKISSYTKCVFIWPDAVWTSHMQMAESYDRFATLSILWDVDRQWYPNSKFIHLWTPQDNRIFYNPEIKRDINVSFIGNPGYSDRFAYLSDVKTAGIDVYLAGGDSSKISVDEYARLLQRSKISLNFCMNGQQMEQLKGRIFEITNCGAMLMESRYKTNWIDRWFVPMVHYVPFENSHDMIEKIRYYLDHDEERRTIAKSGWLRTTEWYRDRKWWEIVFDRCEVNLEH